MVANTEIEAKDVRAKLTEILNRVGQGETFVILKYGKPVARITPEDVQQLEADSAAALEEEKAGQGENDQEDKWKRSVENWADRNLSQAQRDEILRNAGFGKRSK